MDIVPLTPDRYAEWDMFCKASEEAWFWHTTNWIEYAVNYRPEWSARSLSFFVADEREILAVCPLVEECVPSPDGVGTVKEFSLSYGGISGASPALASGLTKQRHDRILDTAMGYVDSLAQQREVVRTTFRLFPLAPALRAPAVPAYNSLTRYGCVDTSLSTQIISLKKDKKKIRYLDFACGTGRIVSAIETFVDESYGIDINQSMLDRAAEKIKLTTLIQGDVTQDETLIDGKFDLITTFRFVLNANPELRDSALKILSNNLCSNDSWLIFNMHTNKYSYAFISYLWYLIFGQSQDKDTKRYLSKSDCIKIANNAGLDVVMIKGLGFMSGKLARILPSMLIENIEIFLAKVPLFNLLGTDLIFFCKKKS